MKKKIEFSKIIFFVVIAIFIIVIVYSMALMWVTQTTDALAYLIPSVSGLAATSVGFYYNKAKIENRIKLSREFNVFEEDIKQIEEETKYESEDI